jgi:porin
MKFPLHHCAPLLLATSVWLHAGETPAPTEKPAATEDATLFPIPRLTGSLWERERLLGDLGGPRQTLAEHGVQVDFSLLQIYQGVADGGETDQWAREVGTTALRTLTGDLIDRSATLRNQLRSEVQALATARLQALDKRAQARFATLPPLVQAILRRKIAAVPPARWQQLRGQVANALNSKIANGRDALGEVINERMSRLDFGQFGNSGDDRSAYFGLWTADFKFDTQKMGLWPGGFLLVRAQGQYGDSVNARSAALMSPNIQSLMPEPGLDDVTLPVVMFTQFLSEKLALAVGKLDTTQGDSNEFAQFGGDARFLNLAFGFNPVIASTAPYSPLGAALIILPTKDLMINLTVMDTEGVATRSGFDTMFKGNTTYFAEAVLKTHFFGLPGGHVLGGTYAHGAFTELQQDIMSFVPGSGVSINQSNDSWSAYYNFHQYVWARAEDPTRGWGFFGRAGFADESTNPIAQFYSIGLGGKGVAASRPLDRFGVGYYYMKTSDDLPKFLHLGDEQGGEAFYNFAVTPAFTVTADVQVIQSARQDVDTAVVLGVRAMMRF